MNYTCHYCFNDCMLACAETTVAAPFKLIEEWQCTKCPVKVRYLLDALDNNKLLIICMGIVRDGIKFAVRLNFIHNAFFIYRIESNTRQYNTYKILEMHFIPDVTPNNIIKKLETYLVFS